MGMELGQGIQPVETDLGESHYSIGLSSGLIIGRQRVQKYW